MVKIDPGSSCRQVTFFAERTDTHVSVIYPKDVLQLIEIEFYDIIFIPLKINIIEGLGLYQKINHQYRVLIGHLLAYMDHFVSFESQSFCPIHQFQL